MRSEGDEVMVLAQNDTPTASPHGQRAGRADSPQANSSGGVSGRLSGGADALASFAGEEVAPGSGGRLMAGGSSGHAAGRFLVDTVAGEPARDGSLRATGSAGAISAGSSGRGRRASMSGASGMSPKANSSGRAR